METVNHSPFYLERLPRDVRNSIPLTLDSLIKMFCVSKAWKAVAEEQLMTWYERKKRATFSTFKFSNQRVMNLLEQHGTSLRRLRLHTWDEAPASLRICSNIKSLAIPYYEKEHVINTILPFVQNSALTALHVSNPMSQRLNHTSLRKLRLNGNGIAEVDTTLIKKSASTLAKLTICRLKLNGGVISDILSLPNLTSLNLKNVKHPGFDVLGGLLIHATRLIGLQALRCPPGGWKEHYHVCLIKHMTSLKKLDLGDNVLLNVGIITIAKSLTLLTSLTAIDFSTYTSGDMGISSIFQHLTHLKTLDLSKNSCHSEIAQHISKLTSLESLTWSSMYITSQTVEAIGKLRFLKILKIPSAEISAASCQQLLSVLPPVRKLDISYNAIDHEGITALARLHASLKWLSIGNTSTNDTDLATLTHSLNNLTNLKILGQFSDKVIAETKTIFNSKRYKLTVLIFKQEI